MSNAVKLAIGLRYLAGGDPQDLFPCLATASGFCSAVKADARGFFEDS